MGSGKSVRSSKEFEKYIVNLWWYFKLSFWAWIYGFIIYFVAFSIFVDLVTSKFHKQILNVLNKNLNLNLKLDGFWFNSCHHFIFNAAWCFLG